MAASSRTTRLLHSPEAVYSFRLLEALRQGEFEARQSSCSITSASNVRFISLFLAGDAKTLQPLLSKLPPQKGPINELISPLHMAARCAEYPTVQLVLSHKTLDINAPEAQQGWTPLHIAASLDRANVVQLLLEQPGINDMKRDKDGKEPLEVSSPEVAQVIQGETAPAAKDRHSEPG